MLKMKLLLFWMLFLANINYLFSDDNFVRENDKSDWIDPTDMLNFDMSTGTMKKSKGGNLNSKTSKDAHQEMSKVDNLHAENDAPSAPTKKLETEKHQDNVSYEKMKNDLEMCGKQKKNLQRSIETFEEQLEKKPVSDIPYLKQYIRALLDKVPDAHTELLMHDSVAYTMNLVLSSEDLNTLMHFVESSKGSSVQDAHRVLVNIMREVYLHPDYQPETWKTWINDLITIHLFTIVQLSGVFALCSVGIVAQVKLKISWVTLFCKLLILLFIVSIPWNWWHLYKIELAQRQAEAMKDMPSECTPKDQSMWQILSSAFSVHVDKCAKYHEKMMVDPVWEVAPTRAIAVTVTKFCLEPLEYIGRALGKFIRAPLEELPVHMWPFALVFVILVFVLVLIMSFGYRIKLFYLFGLEPDSGRKQLKGVDDLQKGMLALTAQVEQLATSVGPPKVVEMEQIVDRRMLAIAGSQKTVRHYEPESIGMLTNMEYVDSRTVAREDFLQGKSQIRKNRDHADHRPKHMIETVTYTEHTRSDPVLVSAAPPQETKLPATKSEPTQSIVCSSSGFQENLEVLPVKLSKTGDIETLPEKVGKMGYKPTLLNDKEDLHTKTNMEVNVKSDIKPAAKLISELNVDNAKYDIKDMKCDNMGDKYETECTSTVETCSSSSGGDKESDNHSNAESFEVIADSDSEETEDRHLSIIGVENIGSLG